MNKQYMNWMLPMVMLVLLSFNTSVTAQNSGFNTDGEWMKDRESDDYLVLKSIGSSQLRVSLYSNKTRRENPHSQGASYGRDFKNPNLYRGGRDGEKTYRFLSDNKFESKYKDKPAVVYYRRGYDPRKTTEEKVAENVKRGDFILWNNERYSGEDYGLFLETITKYTGESGTSLFNRSERNFEQKRGEFYVMKGITKQSAEWLKGKIEEEVPDTKLIIYSELEYIKTLKKEYHTILPIEGSWVVDDGSDRWVIEKVEDKFMITSENDGLVIDRTGVHSGRGNVYYFGNLIFIATYPEHAILSINRGETIKTMSLTDEEFDFHKPNYPNADKMEGRFYKQNVENEENTYEVIPIKNGFHFKRVMSKDSYGKFYKNQGNGTFLYKHPRGHDQVISFSEDFTVLSFGKGMANYIREGHVLETADTDGDGKTDAEEMEEEFGEDETEVIEKIEGIIPYFDDALDIDGDWVDASGDWSFKIEYTEGEAPERIVSVNGTEMKEIELNAFEDEDGEKIVLTEEGVAVYVTKLDKKINLTMN